MIQSWIENTMTPAESVTAASAGCRSVRRRAVTGAGPRSVLQSAGLVQEPVDDEVDGDGEQRDGRGGQQRRDVAIVDQRGVLPDHRAPVRRRRLDAEAEEGERRDGEEHE